ncbi:alanine/glycine:cation symporter family protein [Aciduricibacillus chroicocephali]|uniref:Alanine/glycine:cation symporter family protein n=1 Tax=Aciduricibacillus chroicocephali TaxID=3054939 RepID=A0ABY9KU05_9BACI|nr:alanine/glycine:cation symporter family protein [Bacillaceae bacterium 44XB]
MEFIDTLFKISDFIWAYVLIAVLIGVGLWFTFATKFVQFRMLPEMFRVLFEKETVKGKKEKKGTTAFQAFAISAASRVGTGNLAGVATAVASGGPGALFWMWILALIGSASGFIESTLAQVFKVSGRHGFRGGPAYYIEKGLNMRWLGVVFAVVITITYGLVFNSVQANSISLAFSGEYHINKWIIAGILVVLTALVIFGGLKSIAHVSQLIVPIMAILYIGIALYVLVVNITEIPTMFKLIFENAFGIRQIAGGGFGAAIMYGIKRGLFSNEAGMGSAPNAAATADVSHPAKQGLIQALGVFFDTILVCSATGFIILTAGGYEGKKLEGIQITQNAFAHHIGSWSGLFVAIAILLFAYSSVLGNYYYGESNISYIRESKVGMFIYRIVVLLMVMFGAVASFDVVWDLADFTMAIMALINLYAIVCLSPIAIRVLKDYTKQRKAGKDPHFSKSVLDQKHRSGVTQWGDAVSENEEK